MVGKRFCLGDVETCFSRLRLRNKGVLPKFITAWEDIQIFAGEFRILLPENPNVAMNLRTGEMYPSVKWVSDAYETMLEYVLQERPELLIDPEVVPEEPKLTFRQTLEGSISNTEEKKCSEASRPTSSTISTSPGLPNSSAIPAKPQSPLPPLSTLSPEPKT
jgi:hypothetical protein